MSQYKQITHDGKVFLKRLYNSFLPYGRITALVVFVILFGVCAGWTGYVYAEIKNKPDTRVDIKDPDPSFLSCINKETGDLTTSPSTIPVNTPSNQGTQSAVGSQKEGKIVGNSKSKIYHLPGDPFYNKISDANKVYFATEQDAQAAGYRAAKTNSN